MWKFFPLENITTITVYQTADNDGHIPDLISYFHSNGVRVVFPQSGDLDPEKLTDPSYRKAKIDSWVGLVSKFCYSGFSFDFEAPMYSNATRSAYVDLVRESRAAFDKIDPEISLSMAVPFTAKPLGCLTGRCKLGCSRFKIDESQSLQNGYLLI